MRVVHKTWMVRFSCNRFCVHSPELRGRNRFAGLVSRPFRERERLKGDRILKRYLFLLTAAMLLLKLGWISAAAGDGDTTVAYESLQQSHRMLYEQAMATALAEARERVPSPSRLQAMARGDFNGYTDAKSDGSLHVEYRVSDSIVRVGEKIRFHVNMNCNDPPMIYTVSGLVFDEDFEQTGSLNSSGASIRVDEPFKTLSYSYTPSATGYVNFVLAVSDSGGNQVAVVTSTVMVCDADDPIFKNQSVDVNSGSEGKLGLMLSLDRSKVSVGTLITAQADVTTSAAPVRYRGVWTLTDADGNILDVAETAADAAVQDEPTRLVFPYRPLQAGKLQFVINANDEAGNRVKTNTPVINVTDGYYLEARLAPSSVAEAGEALAARYDIWGHDCGHASYSVTWECWDADGNTVASTMQTADKRSGSASYTSRIGQMVEFRISAACEHFKDTYPATARVALVGGLEGDVSLTDSSIQLGESIGVNYSFEGGQEPYQKVVVKGYTCDASSGKPVCFLEKHLTEAQGMVSGIPGQGSQAYFVVELVEADGHTSSWKTGNAVITGVSSVPGDADGNGRVNAQDALRIMQRESGWPVQINDAGADIDGSGSVSTPDAVEILRSLAKDTYQ